MMLRFLNWARQVIQSMFSRTTVKRVTGIEIPISGEMITAIELWERMYLNDAPWLTDDVRSLNLPAAIASEFGRLVTLEVESSVTGSARAKFLDECYQTFLGQLQPHLDQACALGGMALKPYITSSGMLSVDCTPADRFFPTRFDGSHNITGGVFVDRTTRGNRYYTRFEVHDLANGRYSIRNVAYVSHNQDTLGSRCALAELDNWEDLPETVELEGVQHPLFGYFRVPLANNIDRDSAIGVSVYSRAVDLIRQTDEQWARIQWEYKGSELAIDISDRAFMPDRQTGKPIIPKGEKRLFRALMLGGDGQEKSIYSVFSPAIRDNSQFAGLNRMLQRIEFNCGLAYGTLSDPQTVERTAEEIKSSKQRSYSNVHAMQTALQSALESLVYAMDVWATIGNLAPSGSYETSFSWDDSIITDIDKEFVQRLQLVNSGIMRPEELRQWYLGESEEDAKANLPQADTGLFGGDE